MVPNKYLHSVKLKKPFDNESYLKRLPIIKYLMEVEELQFNQNVTFFIGENGTGKSTLLEGIAVAYGFNAEGGTRNFTFKTNETHSSLYQYLTLVKSAYPKDGFFLRAESFYNLASNIDELDKEMPLLNSYGGRSLHAQSHGESFLSLIENRFSGKGLYILDEPEAALSPSRLMTLLVLIHNLVNKDSQFIIATHSPIIMAYPNAQIYELSKNGVSSVNYQDTDHYKLTKQFLDQPAKMIHYLFQE